MIKVAVIGCGAMGLMHLHCYKELSEKVQVIAVADADPNKTKSAVAISGADTKIYSDANVLIEQEKPDVIDICLPTFLHARFAKAAMEKGCHVFLEKPVCLTPEEAEMLLETQSKMGVKVQVGHVVRFFKAYKWLKETAVSGKYGRIKSAEFKRLSAYPAWSPTVVDYRRSGSVAFDMHIHDADFIRYLLGEPDDVQASATRDDEGVIQHIFVTYKFGDIVATAQGGWDFPKDFPFTAEFLVNYDSATAVLKDGKLTIYPASSEPYSPALIGEWGEEVDVGANVSFAGDYYDEIKYFIEEVVEGGKPGIVPLTDAIRTAKLVWKEIELAGGIKI